MNNQIRNGQKARIDISPKKTSRWPTDTWKDAQYHWSAGKYKSKLQWNVTSHLSEWLKSITQKTKGIGKDVEKKETACTTGGYVSWVLALAVHILKLGMQAGVATLENSMAVSQKVKNRTTL